MSPQTAAQAMAAAAGRLRAAGVPDPARDARLLLAHAAAVDAARVTLIAPEEIAPEVAERFDQLISLRAVRVPVSQLIGRRAFYGRDFAISRDVLDPRPETETLIDLALGEDFTRILDLGTGSGCILVTLLAERPAATGLGVDLSEAACLQASANAVQHGVADRADIRQSDWFSAVEGRFDLILSNPPYIAAAEMPSLAPEVRDHDAVARSKRRHPNCYAANAWSVAAGWSGSGGDAPAPVPHPSRRLHHRVRDEPPGGQPPMAALVFCPAKMRGPPRYRQDPGDDTLDVARRLLEHEEILEAEAALLVGGDEGLGVEHTNAAEGDTPRVGLVREVGVGLLQEDIERGVGP